MASPDEISIRYLSGNWIMDNSCSAGLDRVLKLQGIGWVTRRAISVTTSTLRITQGADTNGTTFLTFEPAMKSGLKGKPEHRPLDWTEFEQNDTLFGRVCIRSRYIDGMRSPDGRLRPLLEIQIKGAGSKNEFFLSEAAATEQQAAAAEGTVEKAFVHDFVRSVDSGWTAEQIWAVEKYGGENVLTRRVVVVTGMSTESARVVYRRE